MLSLVELERAAKVLNRVFVGGRVERWVEPEHGRLAFTIYRRDNDVRHKGTIGIDARSALAHVGLLGRMPKAPTSMPAFSAYLRAHLSRARLEGVTLRAGDRQLALRFSAREGEYTLLLSIFGRRSNLYLLDTEDRLIQALRPLADTRSELATGAVYQDPGSTAPSAGKDRFEDFSDLELLKTIAAHYAEEIGDRVADGDRRQLMTALKKERKSAARRVERIEAELAESEEANTLQQNGELLKGNLGRIATGAATVSVEDFETGAAVEIPLDPKLSAKANLEAIFKRYQKLLRRLTKAGGQVDSARELLRSIEAFEAEAKGLESLEEMLEREEVRRLLARHASRTSGPAGVATSLKAALPAAYRNMPRKLHPRRYRSIDGLEIWVGRSDEANDVLSTRLAKGKDLFFHLDGAPGSHVILRASGREDPPPESILDACELAVHFSKQKNAGRADVHVVPIKNVKKPKGAKRGLVYVTGGKSINLRREAARLERVLAAKIDD
jgi:predicted ribosome quality control (RQC) complex YloA/Tae2 family protein